MKESASGGQHLKPATIGRPGASAIVLREITSIVRGVERVFVDKELGYESARNIKLLIAVKLEAAARRRAADLITIDV